MGPLPTPQMGANKPLKTERAARQQGSSFLRENSSNGGKTIRTFWLHSRSGGRECQEENFPEISRLRSTSYSERCTGGALRIFDVYSPL
jgi:hypothetical protein